MRMAKDSRTRTLFASVNLIGDTVCQSPPLRRYRATHPDEAIHWLIQDDASRCLFERMSETSVCDEVLFDSEWITPATRSAFSWKLIVRLSLERPSAAIPIMSPPSSKC
jgi:hypothetical protein